MRKALRISGYAIQAFLLTRAAGRRLKDFGQNNSKWRVPVIERMMNNGDLGKLLLRMPVGCLMLFHGLNKMQTGYAFVVPLLQKAHLPVWFSHGVIITEVIAPILVVLGIFTRPAAFAEAFGMAMAVWLVHRGQLYSFAEHGAYALELQALYFFGALAVMFLGAGRYSVSRGSGSWN
jgi:putative oxidoreductase